MLSTISQIFYLMTFPLVSMYLYEGYEVQNSGNWVASLLPSLNSITPLIILWAISIFGSIGSFLRKYFRILYSLLLFLIIALTNGADFDHDLFAWFYISILFIFEGRDEKSDKAILDFSKLTIVLIYFMSGFWKLFYSFKAFFNESLGYFHFEGLREIIKESHLLTNHSWPIIDIIPSVILFLIGLGIVILELSGLFLYFKKRSYLYLWASSIIIFHLLTVLTMRVEFVSNIILIGIIFCSKNFKTKQSNPYPH